MTHPNHQTNGASLEDCHTNFFALTELCGIKWRKLVWGEGGGGGPDGDPDGSGAEESCGAGSGGVLDDPVLSAYARCLAAGVLCVWRRTAAAPPASAAADPFELAPPAATQPSTAPPLSLRAAKELWIFWYGEEPDLSALVPQELRDKDSERGSWEVGLSYECRSLLFKALHNLIERCLLSRNFIRLGRWFVQPYDGDKEDDGKSCWHLSFSFAFFVHGESTVCASVDVRQHPPVRTLTTKRLSALSSPHRPDSQRRECFDNTDVTGDNSDQPQTKVILAPYGLEGTLTGRVFPSSDPSIAQQSNAWRQFYPVNEMTGWVEVIAGGVRLRYPQQYVLLTDMDEDGTGPEVCKGPPPAPAVPPLSQHLPDITTDIMAERSYRDISFVPQHQEADIADKSEWDFVDPMRKVSCTCSNGCSESGLCSNGSLAGGVGIGGSPTSLPASPGPQQAMSAPPSVPSVPPQDSAHHPHSNQAVPPTLHTPAATPDPTAPPTPRTPNQYHQPNSDSPSNQQNSAQWNSNGTVQENGLESAFPPWCSSELLKRPHLAVLEKEHDPLDDDHSLDMLYDYSTMHAWLNHPVKKFKGSEPLLGWDEGLGLGGAGGDLYAGHTHTKMAPLVDHSTSFIKLEIKQELNSDDPNKESKNLFTSDGLQASYKDLDQIFDNSDDAASGDETLQVHTPPDSNKSAEEMSMLGGGRGGCIGRVRPEELSKMFPTPPSLEQHPQPSPGYTLNDSDTQLQPQPTLPRPGSPMDEPIEDWSFVFKPPTICKYVGSSKYAPLTGLPSQLMPPVSLPPGMFYRPSWQTGVGPAGPESNVKIERRESPARRSPSPVLDAPSSQNRAPPYPLVSSPVARRVSPMPDPGLRADSLLLNVLLADTTLNVFRDHNFDSCTLCVCNAGAKVVGNIRGTDACAYLTNNNRHRSDRRTDPPASPYDSPSPELSPAPPVDDEPIHCSCGFSAIVNRRLAHRAGLFYEDEMEITGLAEDPSERRKDAGAWSRRGGGVDGAALLEMVREQCQVPSGSAGALARAARDSAREDAAEDDVRLNLLEYVDGGDAAALALAAAAGSPSPAKPKGTVHRWPFIGAKGPRSSRDVFRVMRRLRPLLQRAVRNDCRRDAVAGPLTWRQFHRLAGRGEDLCEPQPVPLLIVGHDRDWLTLSPYALHYWDRLLLEPYSYARDVAYVVVAPESEAVLPQIRSFFKELSSAYETCRLGKHTPLTRISRDGMMRISQSSQRGSSNSANNSEDDWLGSLPDAPYSEVLRAYASTIRTVLAPQLASLSLDRSLLESENRTSNGQSLDAMPPPSTPDHPPTPNSQSDPEGENLNNSGSNNTNNNSTTNANNASATGSCSQNEPDDEEAGVPAIVIYVLEPSASAGGGSSARRSSCAALLRTAASLARALPESLRPAVTVQLIALDAVCEPIRARPHWRRADEMRALAHSVFLQTRRYLVHQPNIKSLTGFGTAANADLFLKSKDEKNRQPYRLYGPAYVLAPPKVLRDVSESFGGGGPAGGPRPEVCSVLYISYCLSADQSWLLAAATDSRGELLETVTINVAVPGRARRRRPAPPARRLGLTKLMDFILGVMSNHVQPWRLVVGRVGRIGHGELKGWSWLLSRKNLLRASTALRDVCRSCSLLYPSGAPCILSACLVSTEPDSALRLMADRFTPDERFSTSNHSQLHTPRDVSCTHILVFPTSARAQSSQKAFEEQHINGLGDDDLFSDLNDDMGDNDFSDIFMQSLMPSPLGSPTGAGGGGEPRGDGNGRGGDAFDGSEASGSEASAAPALAPAGGSPGGGPGGAAPEDVGQLLQQPLALGYLVSTAPLCAMPAWWWAGSPHLRDACPCFIKNALHLHSTNVQQTSDDILLSGHTTPSSSQHPLDSHTTTDVLRYVLEGYNALSWLAMDSNTHDRSSCLPLHVQVLMQMYHTAAAVI